LINNPYLGFMYNVILICTTYEGGGRCNFDELHKIIESIRPEIIFEELSRSNFEKCYSERYY